MAHTAQETLVLDEPLSDIPGLEQKAVEMETAAAELLRKAQALRQIVDGVKALNGAALVAGYTVHTDHYA